MKPMNIFDKRSYYRPFKYPWAYDYFLKQTRDLYWTPSTINFSDDLRDFEKLPEAEKKFISGILTFFTQADTDISAYYVSHYLPLFPQPEVRMMLLSFANMESTHMDAYSKLVEALGLGDYQGFLEYPEMEEKHNYMTADVDLKEYQDVGAILRDIAVGSAFGEGLQLFGSFAMLLSYAERGLFKGMRDVVQWSLRDETLHVKGLIEIFKTIRREYPEMWCDDVKRDIYQACRDMVELEDRFISLVYADGLELPNLPKTEVHEYIRFLADHRLGQLGLKPNYYVDKNPLDRILSKFSRELHEDFFSGTVTSYQHTEFNTASMWG